MKNAFGVKATQALTAVVMDNKTKSPPKVTIDPRDRKATKLNFLVQILAKLMEIMSEDKARYKALSQVVHRLLDLQVAMKPSNIQREPRHSQRPSFPEFHRPTALIY